MHASHPPVAAVLAGGQAARLSGAKAGALLAADTLISYPLAAALNAGLETLVVAKPDTNLPALPTATRVVRETDSRHHPLVGILAALRDTERCRPPQHPVLAIPCDMPFLTAELLAWLAEQPGPEPVATSLGGRMQPFPCVLRPLHTDALQVALDGGLPMRAALERLSTRVLPEAALHPFGEPQELCANVNDRRDLARAQERLTRTTAPSGSGAGGSAPSLRR